MEHHEWLHQLELGERISPWDGVGVEGSDDRLRSRAGGHRLGGEGPRRERPSNEKGEREAVRPAGGHDQETNEAGAQ